MKIRTKLIILTIVFSIATLIFVGNIMGRSFGRILNDNYDEFDKMGEEIGDDIHANMLRNAIDYTEKIVEKQSNVSSETIAKNVRILVTEAETLELMYRHVEKVKDHPIHKGVFLADGIEPTDEIIREEQILSDVLESVEMLTDRYPALGAFYITTASGILAMINDAELYTGYDLRKEKFYQDAIDAGGEFTWGNAYEDITDQICVTGAIAYYGEDGEVAGVVAIDLYMNDYISQSRSAKIGNDGDVFFIVPEGVVVPETDYVKRIKDIEEWQDALNLAEKTPQGVLHAMLDDKNYYLIYDTIEETGWKFCSVLSEKEITEEASRTRAEIQKKVAYMRDEDRVVTLVRLIKLAAILMGCVVFVVIGAGLFAGSFTRPIIKMTEGVKEIGDGNYDYRLEYKSKDEIGQLSESINKMAGDIKKNIEEIAYMSAEKQRIDIEMNLAADIQMAMIPGEKLSFADVEIAGYNDPAMEVGGDFYDYFVIDDNHVGFVIADVSDKGMGAALFMAISKTMINEMSNTKRPLKDIISDVNNVLCRNNPQMQFVTVFEGILDLTTGVLTYVNAGHEKPFIYNPEDGLTKLEVDSNIPLGIMENTEFSEGTVEIKPGGFIFEYTDGVTEGLDINGKQFQEDGIEAVLKNCIENGEDPIVRVQDALSRFCEGTKQFDDITMILLKRNTTFINKL